MTSPSDALDAKRVFDIKRPAVILRIAVFQLGAEIFGQHGLKTTTDEVALPPRLARTDGIGSERIAIQSAFDRPAERELCLGVTAHRVDESPRIDEVTETRTNRPGVTHFAGQRDRRRRQSVRTAPPPLTDAS